ncbi:MAG: NADPH-dependent oxidoreductase [Candidatus Heimdallarchaeota archaeon AB_125]|nr:MAG: NADPH-dependent oxidoreductase [Candidatus Heimdallarchaeota archaeon AB_125]
MNDALDLLKSRRSIRKYKNKPVEEEKIQKCLEAARWAPSASNKQPWEFLIVTDEKVRMKLSEIHPYAKFVSESPVVFVPLTNPEIHQKYHMSDSALATMQYMIEAHSIGLGTCWAGVIGSSLEPEIKELLDVPDNLNVLGLVATGYANEEPTRTRKELEDLVHYEKY